VQAFRLLLTRIKSSRRSAASGVSTNCSSLLAARYAAGGSRQGSEAHREVDNNSQDDDELRGSSEKLFCDEHELRTRFPQLKPTHGSAPRSVSSRKKLRGKDPSCSATDWNFDTAIETLPEDDGTAGSEEAVNRQTGAGISIHRTLPGKKSSYFASKFEKNRLQALQEENAALTAENAKLRDEIKQLQALNDVFHNANSNSSLLDDHPSSSEFAQRRMTLVQAQNMQLRRQVANLQDALQAHESSETRLISALNHWRSVVDAGREEAKAAGADQDVDGTSTGPHEPGSRQPVKWMLAVPDKLIEELNRVEGQIRGAANAARACFETKLRVSQASAAFLRSDATSLQLSDVYSREPSSLAHLRLERVAELENALAHVAAELDQFSALALQQFPPAVSIPDPVRSSAFELGKRVRELILDVGAFGVIVPSVCLRPSQSKTVEGGNVTALDVMKVLSSASGGPRGPAGAKEREKQARVMLKLMHAQRTAMENEAMACSREAKYWRTAWRTQDDILRQLAKRVRRLGQKKVEWCEHYLLTPMVNLAEVFASFQQAYDENTTRQNPYLPLLVETLSMEHPLLEDALKQWEVYSKRVQLKMDGLVADFEANRLVLASSYDSDLGRSHQVSSSEMA